MTRRKRMLKDLEDDIRDYLERETQDNIDRGMSAEEARCAALRKFGNITRVKEETWRVWSIEWLERLLQDLRFAIRSLIKSPRYTGSVVLTLALGLGSVASMLAIVDSVLLRPIAIPDPRQFVMLYLNIDQTEVHGGLTWQQIEDLRRDSRAFTAVAGYTTAVEPVGTSYGNGGALVAQVTSSFFSTLDVHAALGSLPTSDSVAPVAVVSHDFWRERMASDPNVIGSVVHVDGKERSIIGVLPRGASFPSGTGGPVIYTPISPPREQNGQYSAFVVARMKPSVSVAQARSLLAHSNPQDVNEAHRLAIQPYESYLTGTLQKPLFVLLGGVVVLLLIALANAANLQITRAMERMPEMHVRSALGASFSRVLQQLIAESVVLSLLGAALGCALAFASATIIRTEYQDQYARFREVAVHPNVLAAILLLALTSGILASLAPAFSIRRGTRTAALTQRATPRMRTSAFLVTVQVALTCVLLATTGLFARTFRALQQIPLGFNPHHLTNLVLMPVDSGQSPVLTRQADTLLLDHFGSLPGVQSVAIQSSIPFSNSTPSVTAATDVSGRSFQKGDVALYNFVSSDFVNAGEIRLLRGRALTTRDDTSTEMVALVNQAFVDGFLPGRNPIGVTLQFHREHRPAAKGPIPLDIIRVFEHEPDVPLKPSFKIVGVVENQLQGPDLGAFVEPMIYLDYRQIPNDSEFLGIMASMSQFVIRSQLSQGVLNGEIRATLKQFAPTLAEMQLYPMEEEMAQTMGERNLALRLVSTFGAMALLLAAIGMYAILANLVNIRRREIGIRMALGSSRSGVTKLVLRHASWMVLAGVIPGLAGAWVAGRAVRTFLFGVQPLDPQSLAAATAVLLLTGIVAAVLPAWRAARVNPVEVLRVD